MAESVKKTTRKAKATSNAKVPSKASSKKTAETNGVSVMNETSLTNGAAKNGLPLNVTEMKLRREQVAQLAHRFWAERGHQHGHHEEDWYRAEQELRGKAS
jgi:hypothetical protein